jgi:hypothetical protein
MYLTDTFVRAFGYPHHHLWTVGDLTCRLESIRELVSPTDPKLDSTDSIVQALISIPDVPPIEVSVPNGGRQAAFQKASRALCQAKESLTNGTGNSYEWSDGSCTWQESPHSSIDECRNDDVLTYHSFRRGNTTRYSMIVTCWASLTEERRLITFTIGGCANGKMIRVPIGQFSTSQECANDVRESFQAELTSLLLAIYKERKSEK